MKTIIITGPSCSGKTYLSKKISMFLKDSTVIRTDSYYKDSVLIKCISLFINDIYDRLISIKKKELLYNLKCIYNNSKNIYSYYYDFKKRKSFKKKTDEIYNNNIKFLIIEGIFAHRLNLNYQDTLNIVCEEDKDVCFKRRLKRDQIERGRSIKEVKKRFTDSWRLFYHNIKKYIKMNNTVVLNTIDKDSYDKLIIKLIDFAKKN